MNGSSSTYMNNGSRPLIQGLPSPLEYMLYAIGESPSIIARAVTSAVHEEIPYLRNATSKQNPLYASFDDELDIEYDDDDNSFVYSVQAPYAERVRAIEYGGPTAPARPVLRKAAIRSARRLEKTITKNIKKELGA